MANVKIGLFGKLDMLKFKNITKVREKHIQATPATPLPKVLPTNEKAKQHHPEKQEVVIADIRQNGADAKTIVLKTPDGSRLALFRAGQYVSVLVPIGGTTKRFFSSRVPILPGDNSLLSFMYFPPLSLISSQ